VGSPIYTKIVGVTHKNSDGLDRQKLIRRCEVGEGLILRREPRNPVDANAIAVHCSSGQQLGYLPADLAASLATVDLSRFEAEIEDLTGGIPGHEHRGVNISISERCPVPSQEAALPSAMRWEAKGVDKTSGLDRVVFVDAGDEKEALDRANAAGIFVEQARAVDPRDPAFGFIAKPPNVARKHAAMAYASPAPPPAAPAAISCNVCHAGQLYPNTAFRLGTAPAVIGISIAVICLPICFVCVAAAMFTGGATLCGAVGFFLIGGGASLLALRKKILQCNRCGAVIAAS
jgi:hypothetical protein